MTVSHSRNKTKKKLKANSLPGKKLHIWANYGLIMVHKLFCLEDDPVTLLLNVSVKQIFSAKPQILIYHLRRWCISQCRLLWDIGDFINFHRMTCTDDSRRSTWKLFPYELDRNVINYWTQSRSFLHISLPQGRCFSTPQSAEPLKFFRFARVSANPNHLADYFPGISSIFPVDCNNPCIF